MIKDNNAKKRAQLSGKVTDILNKRTLQSAHKRLEEILLKGMSVLDVGCGTGAITYGIAKNVGPNGYVLGIDNNPELIHVAKKRYKGVPSLHFEVGDMSNLGYSNTFDIVTCARVLQWLNDPLDALQSMKDTIKRGGKLVVLDYNHEKIKWEPTVASAMERFYKTFLKWRADASMNNVIADELVNMFQQINLHDVQMTEQHERSTRSDADFFTRLEIWADVAASRGLQMVKDGYLTEYERVEAENNYRKWINEKAILQELYLLAVEGTKR